MDAQQARIIASAEVSHVIVRACALCSGPRTVGEPCADCGNPDPPQVDRVGVVAAAYRNPLRRAWWRLAGRHLANARIRRVNRSADRLRER